ncbi:hypothetical protein E8E14_002313 [Neopestalotiopsis sp. 37M]|nr:hypothetical protein E8E14_002313 [Neopestalotiopsis sp. 37M]
MKNSTDNQWAFVDTPAAMTMLLDSIADSLHYPQILSRDQPFLYIDLEGDNLGRNGTICILQIFDEIKDFTWLVDVLTLGRSAFDIKGSTDLRPTLRLILGEPQIAKVFYDLRNDSDALFAHFGIKLQNVHDLQYMEVVTRKPWDQKTWLVGMAQCIQEHLDIGIDERRRILNTKRLGRKLFSPEQGGSFAVFKQRPLPMLIQEYCVADVKYMAPLWCHYNNSMAEHDWKRVKAGSRQRIKESQSMEFGQDGLHKGLIKEGWGLE